MDGEANASVDVSTAMPASDLRGSVLEVVGALLADNDTAAVLEIVGKLVAENADMARRLARIQARFKKSEKVGKAQLVLFLDALGRGEGEPEADRAIEPDDVDDADGDLRTRSDADELRDDDLAALRTHLPRDPAHVPAPAHLPRVENPIAVPAAQRACPTCVASACVSAMTRPR